VTISTNRRDVFDPRSMRRELVGVHMSTGRGRRNTSANRNSRSESVLRVAEKRLRSLDRKHFMVS